MIGIVVVTHLDLSSRFVEAAERILGKQKFLIAVSVEMNEPSTQIAGNVCGAIEGCLNNVEQPLDGVLILTDLVGSTPANSCLMQMKQMDRPIEIVTGVNLPMLVSSLINRSKLGLADLGVKVAADGKKSIQNLKKQMTVNP